MERMRVWPCPPCLGKSVNCRESSSAHLTELQGRAGAVAATASCSFLFFIIFLSCFAPNTLKISCLGVLGLAMLVGLTDFSFPFEGYFDLVSRHPRYCFGARSTWDTCGLCWDECCDSPLPLHVLELPLPHSPAPPLAVWGPRGGGGVRGVVLVAAAVSWELGNSLVKPEK